MPRTRVIPDSAIFDSVRGLLASEGPRGVTFAAVAAQSGLSGPSLVQRYGSREAMLQQAMLAAWEMIEARTLRAVDTTPLSPKGAVALLKALTPDDPGRLGSEMAVIGAAIAGAATDPVLAERATRWRQAVTAALALRLGGGGKDKDGAAMLFSAWQGRLTWTQGRDEGFRLKDLVKRLTDRAG